MDNAFSCENCTDKECLKTGHICEKVEKLFGKYGIYSADYIRPEMPHNEKRKGCRWREIPMSAFKHPPDISKEEKDRRSI